MRRAISPARTCASTVVSCARRNDEESVMARRTAGASRTSTKRRPPDTRHAPAARCGVTMARAHRMLLALRGVEEGRSYGMPAFKLDRKFFARFRDDDTILV